MIYCKYFGCRMKCANHRRALQKMFNFMQLNKENCQNFKEVFFSIYTVCLTDRQGNVTFVDELV